jgi:hypothetical protein
MTKMHGLHTLAIILQYHDNKIYLSIDLECKIGIVNFSLIRLIPKFIKYIVAEHITEFSKHLEILIFYDNKH